MDEVVEMNLFRSGYFPLSSGQISGWKIDCGALTDEDIAMLAALIWKRVQFDRCEWVPTGGERLGKALQGYTSALSGNLLIVDDVLTTGASMEKQRAGREAIGVVIFARGPTPEWVEAMFTCWE